MLHHCRARLLRIARRYRIEDSEMPGHDKVVQPLSQDLIAVRGMMCSNLLRYYLSVTYLTQFAHSR